MKRIILGKTGIKAIQLGFGGIPIQRVSEKQAIEVLTYALEKGMDFIDTSRMYTTSENRIGKALKETAKKVILATKSFSRSSDGIQRDIETSLKELQTDFIDLYQCHAVSNGDEYLQVTAANGALHGLQKAREQGIIGHVGITSHNLDVLEKAVEDGLFETIMVCFSFLEPAAEEKVIPKAREKQMGIIAMKPLSGGVIRAKEAAFKWVFSHPDILVLAGVEEKSYIDQNWKIFQNGHALTDEDMREIREIRKELDRKFCRRCDYCLPCTAEIPIQFALGVRSMVKRMGPGILQQPMFKDIREKALNCTECGDCMERCPYDLPIPDMIKENLKWLDEVMSEAGLDTLP